MKRAFVYKNRDEDDGKVLVVENSMEAFKTDLKNHFGLNEENVKIYFGNGCEILDIRVIRDNEKIYLSTSSLKGGKYVGDLLEKLGDMSIGDSPSKSVTDWITLNIGGRLFTTSRTTLLVKEPSSMLARMFADDNNVYLMNPSVRDGNGAFLIDRSPEYFEPILNYLRHGVVVLDNHVNPRGVLEEAVFYGIDSMLPQLIKLIEESRHNSGSNHPLSRMDVVHSIIKTPITSELRFQGVNLAGADLNRLDLRYINFKYACLSHCNLSGANLSHCCLERADLSHANLEGTQLLGVKALCANFEGNIILDSLTNEELRCRYTCAVHFPPSNIHKGIRSRFGPAVPVHFQCFEVGKGSKNQSHDDAENGANLKGCNMEDPTGIRAILEGVNLKGCNLEGSNMAGVNLRVATLKNANLQNCDLRTAVLAGADLESCDLSGSDLHEANLRGANLKDAAFELMLTPLHMSQTL